MSCPFNCSQPKEVDSNSLRLSPFLLFADAPLCANGHEEVLGALKHETLQLKCEVDSSPPPTSYHWTFLPLGEQTESPTRLQSNEVRMGLDLNADELISFATLDRRTYLDSTTPRHQTWTMELSRAGRGMRLMCRRVRASSKLLLQVSRILLIPRPPSAK